MRGGERTVADVSSLLVELARVLRGLGFYPEGDPRRTRLLDRAYLAYQAELGRVGPLEVFVDANRFRATGVADALPHGRLGDVAQALRARHVERFRFDPDLTRDAFHAFAELVEWDVAALAQAGGFEAALRDRSNRGIALNGAAPEAPHPATSVGAARASAPHDVTASLGSALLARTNRLVAVSREVVGPRTAPGPQAEKPDIDAEPLAAPATEPAARRQLERLIELDRAHDDDAYRFLAERIVESAQALFEAGHLDECYRAILVLAGHACGEGGRSGLQARSAQALCAKLASGAALDDLIERARVTDGPSSVRATQVLLQLGAGVVDRLLDRLSAEQASEAAGQITAILIVLGDAVVPHLEARIRRASGPHANLAVRLAGELQNPALSPLLAEVMRGPSPAQRRDAARALAQIGGETALHALTDALSSQLPDLPEIAAHCLGVMGQRRACAPLMTALDHAIADGRMPLCRELIRALGQLGEERAVPKLVSLVERSNWLRRGPVRELKLTSLTALDKLPGKEARRTIERARHSRDPLVRKRAEELIEAQAERAARRAGSVAKTGGSLHSRA